MVSGIVTPVYARFWLIEMADPYNAAAYIDFAKLIVSPAFQPTRNFSYNWTIEWVDPSVTTRARGGQVYADPRRMFRRLIMDFANQQTVEAFSRFYELDRTQGKTQPVLAIVNPNDAANLHRQTIYGSMPELSPLTGTMYDRFSKRFTLEEWI